jgi:tRNA(His) 5'-end guanylyltransferase
MKNDAYGDRMKEYEAVTRTVLPRRTYTIVRVDGRAFHTYLKNAKKPFDRTFMGAMQHTAKALCENMSGARFAYTQSDEISVLLTDLDTKTQPWFGGEVQKIVSVSASIATAAFNEVYGPRGGTYATFDSRAYTIPDRTEVLNYFQWRQQDAIRNAVSMAAHAHFSHKSLHGVNTDQMQERLFQEKGINFKTEYGDAERRGSLVHKALEFAPVPEEFQQKHGRPPVEPRTKWEARSSHDFYVQDCSRLSNLVPANGSGPAQEWPVQLFGYPIGDALIQTAMSPAGALWAATYFRQEFDDDSLFRAWMVGANPLLSDRTPTFELLQGRIDKVLDAHRAYADGSATS